MAATSNATLLADLIDPQVIADYVNTKLVDNIRLSPLARIDNTLVGRPGDEVTLPQYSYVGDAVDVNEGADIPIAKLSQTTDTVKVSKIGRAIEFSDEAILSAYNNDIATEAAKQVLVAINSAVEGKLIDKMDKTATLTSTIAAAADPADGVADALTKFGEDMDGAGVLAIPPSLYARLRKSKNWIPNTEIGADMIIRGRIGMIHGLDVVPMNRLSVTSGSTTTETAYIIRPGALAIYMKRDTLVEFDRDILSEMNYIKASKLFAPYVYDKSKLIKVKLS